MSATRENARKILLYMQDKGVKDVSVLKLDKIKEAIQLSDAEFGGALYYLGETGAIGSSLGGVYRITDEGRRFLEQYDGTSDIVTREEIEIINAKIQRLTQLLSKAGIVTITESTLSWK